MIRQNTVIKLRAEFATDGGYVRLRPVIDFESESAFRNYQQHPKHVELATTFVPHSEQAVRVHYEV